MQQGRRFFVVLAACIAPACGSSPSNQGVPPGDDAGSTAVDADRETDGASGTTGRSDGAVDDATSSDAASSDGPHADVAVDETGDALPPLPSTVTDDFAAFLAANGFSGDDFIRRGTGGSFGGRDKAGDPITQMPIVFVHGNADSAIGRTSDLSGWDSPRRYLLGHGYTSASLYGTTWGPADASLATQQRHDHTYLLRLRRFLTAVLGYTGAPTVAVVSHSMGVTLMRKAIEGGAGTDAEGAYDLGAPMTGSVDTFIGIAGGNVGLTGCYVTPDPPTCSKIDGFWPGASASEGPSKFLAAINATKHDEGAFVFSRCSSKDEVLGLGGIVWSQDTCAIPGEDKNTRDDSLQHVPLKDQSGPALVKLIQTHAP